MKAPDKIYIPIIEEDGKKLLCTNWWETDARSRYVNETIPYIRKDALIDALNKILDARPPDAKGPASTIAAMVFQQLIDKLKEI